ncbi:MAG: CHAT domain-containing protein [Planctomycetota bacterium]
MIGRLARARGAASEARAAFLATADLAERVRQDDWRERALLGLLALERDAGDPFAARAWIDELATFRSPSTCWALAREHAASLLHDDRAEEAAAFLARYPPSAAHVDSPVESIAQGGDQAAALEGEADPEATALALEEWRALRAAAALRLGDVALARELVDALDVAPQSGEAPSEHTILARAALALEEGDTAQVRALTASPAPSWSTAGRTLALVLSAEALCEEHDLSAGARALREALTTARAWESERASRGGSVLGEWIGLHAVALLARVELELGSPLEAVVTALEYQARSLRGWQTEVDAATVQREAASASLGLVTWVIGPDFTVVLHVDRTGVASGHAIPLGRSAIERGVTRLRQAIRAGDDPTARALGEELARTLLPSRLRDALALRAMEALTWADLDLVVIAQGALERAPFGAFAIGGAPLIDLGALRVMPGLLPSCATPGFSSATARWVLAGDPCDQLGRSLLPDAASELRELARVVRVSRSLAGPTLTPDALLAALDGKDPLHIATHLVPATVARGERERRAAPYALECSRGTRVSAREVSERAPRLPLVVLAACASADGEVLDGEGALGFARAFLTSGTRGAVATTWPISDAGARQFALALHAHMARGEQPSWAANSAARALRAARRPAAEWAAYRFEGRD